MSDRVLFWIPTLLWASTWHAILYQLGTVPPLNSVAYRFALASALLFGWAFVKRASLAFSLRDHAWLAATGVIQYGLNYVGVYAAEQKLPSGLVAVLFSLLVFGNAAGGALFFAQPITRRVLTAAVLGTIGVAMIFWPEVAAASARPGAGLGLLLGLGAVCASLAGNLLTLRLRARGLDLLPLLAWSMAYGSVSLIAFALVTGVGLSFDWRPGYLISLAYLSVFGSVVAFVLYFKLAHRQGPARASLMAILIPIVALVISTLVEGYRPDAVAIAGVLTCIVGVMIASKPPSPRARTADAGATSRI